MTNKHLFTHTHALFTQKCYESDYVAVIARCPRVFVAYNYEYYMTGRGYFGSICSKLCTNILIAGYSIMPHWHYKDVLICRSQVMCAHVYWSRCRLDYLFEIPFLALSVACLIQRPDIHIWLINIYTYFVLNIEQTQGMMELTKEIINAMGLRNN